MASCYSPFFVRKFHQQQQLTNTTNSVVVSRGGGSDVGDVDEDDDSAAATKGDAVVVKNRWTTLTKKLPPNYQHRLQHHHHHHHRPWWEGMKNGFASALAAACVKAALQPIDAIKTIQQYAIQQQQNPMSVLQAYQYITHQPGGFRNLYAGLGVTVIGAMPGVALYFGVYSYCKQHLLSQVAQQQQQKQQQDGSPQPWFTLTKTGAVALSAAIGNSVASFSRVPYETMKQKLQAGMYTSTWEAICDICSGGNQPSHAMQLLFPPGGIAVQMIRDVPYAVVTLLVYETLQSSVRDFFHTKLRQTQELQLQQQQSMMLPVLSRKRHLNHLNSTITSSSQAATSTPIMAQQKITDFVVGGVAGGIGSWVTTPMDVIVSVMFFAFCWFFTFAVELAIVFLYSNISCLISMITNSLIFNVNRKHDYRLIQVACMMDRYGNVRWLSITKVVQWLFFVVVFHVYFIKFQPMHASFCFMNSFDKYCVYKIMCILTSRVLIVHKRSNEMSKCDIAVPARMSTRYSK
jgi:hypothetical protein